MSEPHLRPFRPHDTHAVLMSFLSAPDMRRQGDVHDEDSAARYVENLLAKASPHRPWVIAHPDDSLAGLVVVTVDNENRNGWFWYWMNAADRGRG